MKQYDAFIIDSYDYDPGTRRIRLRYALDDDVTFSETLDLPEGVRTNVSEESLHQSMLALLMAGGPSYYKTCLPSSIRVKHALSEDQIAFWNSTYQNGLGEFFYQNDIDFRGLINIATTKNDLPLMANLDARKPRSTPRVLVPIGGGKDSMVTIELLRKQGVDITLLRVGTHPLINEMAKTAGLPILNVKRSLAPELFALNAQGALNGHVPITAYISALSIVLALLYDFDAVAFSNERSADEGNVKYLDTMINHQWSKSLAFESAFQDYVHLYVNDDIDYFSMLRPLSELHITKLFAEYEEYLGICTSCNANWRIVKEASQRKWCGECPKCAFVFAMLAAFIPVERLTHIFGTSPFDNESLIPLYDQLLGIEGFKPFECVGTPKETQAAFLLAHEKGDFDDTVVMRRFTERVLPTIDDGEALVREACTPTADHRIPKPYLPDFL